MRAPVFAWLPDIAANLVAVLIILIAIAATSPDPQPDSPQPLHAHSRAPMSGAEMVAALYTRVTLGMDGIVDLTADGIISVSGPAPRLVFILETTHYPDFTDMHPNGWQAVFVPDALKTNGRWSPAFLELATAPDQAAFVDGLYRILSRHGQTMPSVPAREASWQSWLQRAQIWVNATLLICALWLIRLAYRRSGVVRRRNPR